MNVILEIMSGPTAGRKIRLKAGQVARFGRTEWADFSFPQDGQMADVHFALECLPQGCRLRDLDGAGRTLLDGEPVAEAAVSSGCRITAGQTTFAVQIEGEPARSEGTSGGESGLATSAPQSPAEQSPTASEMCGTLELGDEARGLLNPEQTPEEFLDVLSAHELYADALRCRAHWLPRPQAVRWGSQCVRETSIEGLSAVESAALEAAERWAAEPTEEHRRAAEQAAEAARLDRAAGWVAQAAFWSGGSLSAPGHPEVPPPPHLTGQAITAALLLSAAQGDPTRMAERYQAFLTCARALADQP